MIDTPYLRAYLSGYADGEGCFCVTFTKSRRYRNGWDIRPSFSVSQNADRAEVLLMFQQAFGCGAIRPDRSDKTIKYETRSISDIALKIIPHFQEYPLLSGKKKEFESFAAIVQLLYDGKHLTPDGFAEVLVLASLLNAGSRKRYAREEIGMADKGIVYAAGNSDAHEVPACTKGVTT
jgi:hypothetical protein